MSEQGIRLAQIDWTRVAEFAVFCKQLALKHNGSETSGARSLQRNAAVGGSRPPGGSLSRHTFKGGWGMAQDFMFDSVQERISAQREVVEAGYVAFRGTDYHPAQLHVQAVRRGVELER